MNSKLNPATKVAIALAVLLTSGWFLLRRYEIAIGISAAPNQVPIVTTQPDVPTDAPNNSPSPSNNSPSPSNNSPNDPAPADTKIAKAETASGLRQGSLRVSNRTEHPIRVALLARQAKDGNAKSGGASQTGFAVPTHWDFAPGEGGAKGLRVSLPDRDIRLKKGDVVVAFAQDGTQRYWGPFVVGETDRPDWNTSSSEWTLDITP